MENVPYNQMKLPKRFRVPKAENAIEPKAASAVAWKMANVVVKGKCCPRDFAFARYSRPLDALRSLNGMRLRRLLRAMHLNEENVLVSDLCSVVDAGCFGAGAGAMFQALVASMHPSVIHLPVEVVAEDAENIYAYILVCSGVAKVNDAGDTYAPIKKLTKIYLTKRAKDIAATLDDTVTAEMVKGFVKRLDGSRLRLLMTTLFNFESR